jgi:hypothetical protein
MLRFGCYACLNGKQWGEHAHLLKMQRSNSMVSEVQRSIISKVSPKAPQHYTRHLMRVVVALVTALVLAEIGFLLHPLTARAYSCGDLNINHCYAINDWSQFPSQDQGGETDVQVAQLTCNCSTWYGGEAGFIDDEMWVANYGDTRCSNQHNSCWVEAGYLTTTSAYSTTTNYFWADNRPNLGFTQHVLAQVPSGDYGHNANLLIWRNFGQTNRWIVDISTPNYGYSTYSTSNDFNPTDIQIGQELAGTSGASASNAYFSDNYYVDNMRNFVAETLDGSITYKPPPYDYWLVYPHNSSSGGIFVTYCR